MNLLDKREFRTYKGVARDGIYHQACDFWANQGFYVAQTSPYQVQGQSYYQKIGLKREFYMWLSEQGGDTTVDLQFKAAISDEGLIGGVAAAVIFWPAALIGGAWSYTEYESEAREMMGRFWTYLDQVASTRGVASQGPPTAPPPPPPPVQTTPCQGCGALLPGNWKACPYCGRGRA